MKEIKNISIDLQLICLYNYYEFAAFWNFIAAFWNLFSTEKNSCKNYSSLNGNALREAKQIRSQIVLENDCDS